MDLDQAQGFVEYDLVQNCLQRFSTDSNMPLAGKEIKQKSPIKNDLDERNQMKKRKNITICTYMAVLSHDFLSFGLILSKVGGELLAEILSLNEHFLNLNFHC